MRVSRSWRTARDVDRRDDDPLAGSGRCLGEQPAVEVDDLAAAGPGVRRIVPEARALVRRDDERHVLERAAAVHERPPVHRLGGAPGIHVRRHANQHLRAVGGELADRFGKQPVVTDRATEAADWRVGDREQRLVVPGRGRAGSRGPRTGSRC